MLKKNQLSNSSISNNNSTFNNSFSSTSSNSCNNYLKSNDVSNFLSFNLQSKSSLNVSLLPISQKKNDDKTEFTKVRLIRAHHNCVAVAYLNYFCCYRLIFIKNF